MKTKVGRLGLVVVASMGCSAPAPSVTQSAPAPVDAGVSKSNAAHPAAIRIVESHAAYRGRLASAEALTVRAGRYYSDASAKRPRAASVSLPLLAGAPTLVEAVGHHGFSLDVAAADLAPIPGRVVAGALIYERAAPSLDVLRTIEPRLTEELRVLHDERAPATHRWTIEVGPAVGSGRVHDDRVEFFDRAGYAALQADPITALDADERAVPVTLSLTRLASRAYELEVRLDLRAARFPVVLDPAWTTAPSGIVSAAPSVASAAPGQVVECARSTTSLPYGASSLFDLASNTWTKIPVPTGVRYPACFATIDGRAAMVPDETSAPANLLYVLNTATKTWDQLLVAGSGIVTNTVEVSSYQVALADGSFYFQGARKAGSLVSPTGVVTSALNQNTFGYLPADTFARADGSVVTANCPACASDVSLQSTPGAALKWLSSPAFLMGAARLGSDIYLAGGCNANYNSAFCSAPSTAAAVIRGAAVTTLPSLTTARFRPAMFASGNVLVVAGGSGPGVSTSEYFDPVASKWTAGNALAAPAIWSRAAALDAQHTLLVGGIDGTATAVGTAQVYFAGPPPGTACTATFDCRFGNTCVDSVCCGTASCPAGYTCNAGPSTAGTCAKILGSSCTTTTLCDSGNCIDGVCCESTCGGGKICNGSGNPGKCRLPNGAAATDPSVCGSGAAVDGVCCDTTCTSNCQACIKALTGQADGTCANALDGLDPHASCLLPAPSCAANKLTNHVCNGSGACRVNTADCAPYACAADGKGCASACALDTDCIAGQYCTSASVCAAKRDVGANCGAGHECALGLCVDGYCCNAACTGQCEACNLAGVEGTCAPVTGAPHGARLACSSDAKCGGLCDGALRNSCKYPSAGTACATSCAGQTQTNSACDGSGACVAASSTTQCAPFLCDATSCKATCTSDDDCTSGAYCTSAGVCALKGDTGKACKSAKECAGGNCVDGYCCNSACTGSCEACDTPGKLGLCVNISDAPHGARSACAGAGTDCAGRCTGTLADCSYPAANTACGAGCASGKLQSCDGAGGCSAAKTCDGNFACADPKSCATICATSADCIDGYGCVGDRCTPNTSTCSADGTTVIPPTGPTRECKPYRCNAGDCYAHCADGSQCLTGYRCDATGSCVPSIDAAASQDSGGCAMGSPGGQNAFAGIALLAVIGLARRRR